MSTDCQQNGSNLPARKEAGGHMKHALWIAFEKAKVDRRTRLGKTMTMLRRELVKHCGGTPSISERIIIERIIAKTIKCHLYEMGVLSNPSVSMGSRDHYLSCANSLRLDIALLGLKPKTADKVLDLGDYLRSKQKTEQGGSHE